MADPLRIEQVGDEQFLAYADAAGVTLPIEQTPVWDRVDAAIAGRRPWRRLGVWDAHAEMGSVPTALLSFTEYDGRGFRFVWARHAPVWLDATASPPSAHREAALREALVAYVRREAPLITFVRLHAWHPARDLQPLLQTITYDRTVVVNLALSEEERMAALSSSTRKKLRRTLADAAVTIADETAAAATDFSEYYAILEETAVRDGFGVYDASVYQNMIVALGPHARVFVARRSDTGADGTLAPGRAVSWILSVVNGTHGLNFYSGQTAEGRATNIGVRLRWHVFGELAAAGVTHYDLMGVDSALAPSLKGVGEFKRQFGEEVAVDPAWDAPTRPGRYRALRLALRVKRMLRL